LAGHVSGDAWLDLRLQSPLGSYSNETVSKGEILKMYIIKQCFVKSISDASKTVPHAC
jgi:hypothetical protein